MNKMFPLKSFFSWKEKKKEKKNSRLSGIPGYLLSIGLCVVFALYCSGSVGWFLVLTFICAPILSLLFTLLFRKQITAACRLETPLAAKGEHGILTVSLQSKGFLPSPFITITFTDSPYLTCGEPLLTLSLLPVQPKPFSLTLQPLSVVPPLSVLRKSASGIIWVSFLLPLLYRIHRKSM